MDIEITLADGDGRVGWDGKAWAVLDGGELAADAAATLNALYQPGNPAHEGVGDHHFPPGVGPALRGAEAVGGAVSKAPQWPAHSLPAGAIS